MHSAEGTVVIDAGILAGHLHVPRLRIGACALGKHGLPNGPRPTTQVSRWRGPQWWGLPGFLSFVLLSFAAVHEIATESKLSVGSGSEHGSHQNILHFRSVQYYSKRPCS